MSLNRKVLRELKLEDDVIEQVLSLHHEAVDALRTELDEAVAAAAGREEAVAQAEALRSESAAHQEEAARLQTELDAFRRQVHEERTAAGRQSALEEALRQAGANEYAVPLLAQAIQTSEEDWDGASLTDAAHTLAPVTEQYAAFFSEPVPLPTQRVTPPLSSAALLTHQDLRAMTAEEINQNWSQVRQALQLPE